MMSRRQFIPVVGSVVVGRSWGGCKDGNAGAQAHSTALGVSMSPKDLDISVLFVLVLVGLVAIQAAIAETTTPNRVSPPLTAPSRIPLVPPPSEHVSPWPDDNSLVPLPAPTDFTAEPLGGGAVKAHWHTGPADIVGGTGFASSGVYVSVPSTNVVIENMPPGPGIWRIASVLKVIQRGFDDAVR
jgi:hypothetical protein